MTHTVKGIIFDIDGTLIRGDYLLPHVSSTLAMLREAGYRLVFLTNDNQCTQQTWVERLSQLGLVITAVELLTAATIAATAVAHMYPRGKVLPVGTDGLLEALQLKELQLVWFDDAAQADVVVMGNDPAFNQMRLAAVCQQIWGGAQFIATNDDPKMPVHEGFVPGTGPMVKAVAYATGVEPLVTGKPSPWAGRIVLDTLALPAEQVVIVGDQLMTDIMLGKAAGFTTILTLTGTSTALQAAALPPDRQPDIIIDDLSQLRQALDNINNVLAAGR